jgi:acetolactate decarboxylase
MSHCLHFLQTTLAHLAPGKRLHHDAARGHEIYQTSVMSAVMDGLYEGSVTIGELARHGDFGVGTFNALDGEMVALDG